MPNPTQNDETRADNFRQTETGNLECIGGSVTAWTHVPPPATRKIYALADEISRLSQEMERAREAQFSAIVTAYIRGAQWWQRHHDARYVDKAACDYADYVTSALSPPVSGEDAT